MYNNNGLAYNPDQPTNHVQLPLPQVPQIQYIPNEIRNEYVNIVNSLAGALYNKAMSPNRSPIKYVFNKYSVNNFNNNFFANLIDILIKIIYSELRNGKQPNLNSILEYLFSLIVAKEVNDNPLLRNYCVPQLLNDLPNLLQQNNELGNRLQNVYQNQNNYYPQQQNNNYGNNGYHNQQSMQPNQLANNFNQNYQHQQASNVDWKSVLNKSNESITHSNNTPSNVVNNVQEVINKPTTTQTSLKWIPHDDNDSIFLFAYEGASDKSIIIRENGKLKQTIIEGEIMDRNAHLLSYLNTPKLDIRDTKSLEKEKILENDFKIENKDLEHDRDLSLEEAIVVASIHLDNFINSSIDSRTIKCINLKTFNNRFLGVGSGNSIEFINVLKSKKTLEKAHSYLLLEISKLNADESAISPKEMNIVNKFATEIINDFLRNRLCITATISSFIEDYRNRQSDSLENYIQKEFGTAYKNGFVKLENIAQEILSTIEISDNSQSDLIHRLGLVDLYKSKESKPLIITIPENNNIIAVDLYSEQLGIEFHRGENGEIPKVAQLVTKELTPITYSLIDKNVGVNIKTKNYLVTLDNVIYEVFFNIFAGDGYLIRLKNN